MTSHHGKLRLQRSLALNVITIDTTTVFTEAEYTIHIEHFFDIGVLEGLGLNIKHTLLYCGIRGYSNDPQLIYPKLIRMF